MSELAPALTRKTHGSAAAAPVPAVSAPDQVSGPAGFPLFLQRQSLAGDWSQGERNESLKSEENAEIQPRLIINGPGDAFEREADRVAQQVLSPDSKTGNQSNAGGFKGSDAAVQRKCAGCAPGHACPECIEEEEGPHVQEQSAEGIHRLQRKCAACGAWDEQLLQRTCAQCGQEHSRNGGDDQGERAPVSRKPARSDAGSVASGPSAARALAFRGGGQPLQQSTRDFFEPRFGQDFGDVRLHTGGTAAESAREMGALAYTLGQDIVFGAGAAAPESVAGQELLAHELVHTVQQTGGRPLSSEPEGRGPASADGPSKTPGTSHQQVQRWPSASDVLDSLDEAVSDVGSTVEDTVDAVGDAASDAADAVGETISDAAEVVSETASDVGERIIDTGAEVADVAGQAVDWLATEAGQVATWLADSLGAVISVTSAGLEIVVPRFCPLGAIPYEFDLESIDGEFMVPIFELPLGPVAVAGEVGLAAHLQPQAAIQVGPFCVNGMRILINPFTGAASIIGSVSVTAAASLGAEVRCGLRGALSLQGIVLIGDIPVPIDIPVIGVEGGGAGLVRGIGAGTLTIGGGLSIGGGRISMSRHEDLDFGLAGDLFLGAYAQLDILGHNVCRIYWEPLAYHDQIAASLGMSMGLSIGAGGSPSLVAIISAPTFSGIPFSAIPLALSRKGFADDCPIKDAICEVLRALNLLPSQKGGTWDNYGPGPRLTEGPLEVYPRNPGIASKSLCRGACGPDCDTCKSTPFYFFTDPATGDVWQYDNFEDCNSNEGCRQHDAGFDWAAAEHDEIGDGAIIMPWHMAANMECACNYPAGNCAAWIAGLPPYDKKMYFADDVRKIGAGIPILGGPCREEFPNAPDCNATFPDRDAVLAAWGESNGIGNFRDCAVVQDGTSSSLIDCEGGPGNLWHCRATDIPSGQDITVSIMECICCAEDVRSAQWMNPQVVIEPGMSEELILDLCERNLIPRVICIPIEEDMIRRFGNERRDMDLDPDEDPEAHPRPDDAPIMASFRKIYNRLDSWNIFIRTNHPDLFSEFESTFQIEQHRQLWLDDLKARTKEYKDKFRDIRNTDPKQIEEDFKAYVLGNIQAEIEKHVHDIAVWYKAKTDSDEPIEQLIERVHTEGTELWRAAWRKAILQVNRVLARLWPPAKVQILVWIDQERSRHPDVDLSGPVGEVDYIGSLATGFKGPPKQQVRFNPDKFDVDANLAAPPLAKYAVALDGLRPDRQRIFGRKTTIAPLNEFSDQTQAEMVAQVDGYDASDPFDVAIDAAELPEQTRERVATERLYELRSKLDDAKYTRLVDELATGGYLTADGRAIRPDLTEAQFDEANAIMDRHAQ